MVSKFESENVKCKLNKNGDAIYPCTGHNSQHPLTDHGLSGTTEPTSITIIGTEILR